MAKRYYVKVYEQVSYDMTEDDAHDVMYELKRAGFEGAIEEIDEDDHDMIICEICGEFKPVEIGTRALDARMCEPCYCEYQGG